MQNWYDKVKNNVRAYWFHGSIVFAIALIGYKLRGLFSSDILPGWDNPPHIYALKFLVTELLPHGRITGWDMQWFGGFPQFYFYAPLLFIAMGITYLIAHLSGISFVTVESVYRVYIMAASFLYVYALYAAVKEFFGAKVAKFAPLFSLFFLFADKSWKVYGLGLPAAVHIGLVSGFVGASLFLLAFAYLHRLLDQRSLKNLLITSVCCAALVLTHTISFVFFVLAAAIYGLIHFKKIRENMLPLGFLSLLTFVLSAWWLVPFLKLLKFSNVDTTINSASVLELFISPNLGRFFVLLLMIAGIRALAKVGNIRFVAFFIVVLLTLGSDMLYHQLNIEFHFFRFYPLIYSLYLMIVCVGARAVVEVFQEKLRASGKKKKFVWASGGIFALVILLAPLLSYTLIGIQHFFPERELLINASNSSTRRFEPEFKPASYHWHLSEYEQTPQLNELIEWLKEQPVNGRIFAETDPRLFAAAGSPQIFISRIADELNKPLLSGLYAESALSTPFIMPTTASISRGIAWGSRDLIKDVSFMSQSSSAMIRRLQMYNVEYIIGDSEFLKEKLGDAGGVTLVKEFDLFYVYKISSVDAKLSVSPTMPPLFVGPYKNSITGIDQTNESALTWKNFSEQWFKNPVSFEFPIVRSSKERLRDLEFSDYKDFEVIIIAPWAYTSKRELEQKVEEMTGKGKLVLLLGREDKALEGNKFVQQIPSFDVFSSDIEKISGILSLLNKDRERKTPDVHVETFANEQIKARIEGNENVPILINTNFFPNWNAFANGNPASVYQVTPSLMLVFAHGDLELTYTETSVERTSKLITLFGIPLVIGASIFFIRRKKPQ